MPTHTRTHTDLIDVCHEVGVLDCTALLLLIINREENNNSSLEWVQNQARHQTSEAKKRFTSLSMHVLGGCNTLPAEA